MNLLRFLGYLVYNTAIDQLFQRTQLKTFFSPQGSGGDPHAGPEPLHLPVGRVRLRRGAVRAHVRHAALLQYQQPRPGDSHTVTFKVIYTRTWW